MNRVLLTLLGGLTLGLASAQTPAPAFSIMNIPALPPGATAPKPAAPTSTPTATPPATTPVTTTPAPTAPVTPAPVTPAPVTPAPNSLPSVTTLPTAARALPGSYTVSLSGPAVVRAGEANTWSFNLKNTGNSTIHLEHGACDVRFEVLNSAGEVVRPDPKNAICTMQLVITDAAPGESAEVQRVRWEGKDGQGQPVPAGEYTIRAKYVGGGMSTPAAVLKVTVQ